jgi:hypothetical protein
MSRPSSKGGLGLTGWAFRAIVATLAIAGLSQLWTKPTPLPAAPIVSRNDARMPVVPGMSAPPGLKPGQVRSLLNVPGRLRYGDFRWNDTGVPSGRILIRVDRRAQILSVFRDGHEIGTAVILYGAPEKPTPAGTYPVLGKALYHRSATYNADMPFTLWLTDDGVAIHGSRVRDGAATHGCVGLPEDFARKLFHEVHPGDPVVIV